jgi:hypothetical protein
MQFKRKKLQIAITMALSLSHGISQAQFSAELNLSDLNGSNGLVINGVNPNDESGQSVSYAGDINGDGIDDVIIGSKNAAPNGNDYAGSSYVVFGSGSGLPNPFNLSTLDGTNGFVINGIMANDYSGRSVSQAGDINGDGIDDLIIGAHYAGSNGNAYSGSSYVVFGKDTGFTSPLELSSLNGANGFVINGINTYDNSGYSVSQAGDFNGDGIDDLIIGATEAGPNGAGASYVVFGKTTGFSNSLDLLNLDGTNGLVLNGIGDSDRTGFSVSQAGDINNDGIDDLIIGAATADPNNLSSAGSSYVVFGKNTGFTSSLDLSTLDGTNGFVINGVNAADASGSSVSQAGDVNGDGIDDVIIGAYVADPNNINGAGSSYVVFGSDTGFTNTLELSNLNGSNGFVINGVNASDTSGKSVSHAGDVNGDGIDDVIIGAKNADPNNINAAGSSYVVFGSDLGFVNPLELSSLDGTNGFVITGVGATDVSGTSVSHAGDINDDGFDDLIIGAINADPNNNNNAGSSYIVYGKEKPIFANGFEQYVVVK